MCCATVVLSMLLLFSCIHKDKSTGSKLKLKQARKKTLSSDSSLPALQICLSEVPGLFMLLHQVPTSLVGSPCHFELVLGQLGRLMHSSRVHTCRHVACICYDTMIASKSSDSSSCRSFRNSGGYKINWKTLDRSF